MIFSIIIIINNNNNNRKTTKTRKEKRVGKQLYEYFKWQTGKIALEKPWIWLNKGYLMS